MYNMYTSHNTKLGLVRVVKSVYGSQLAQPRCHFNMIMIFDIQNGCVIMQRCISSAAVQNGEYLRNNVGRK